MFSYYHFFPLHFMVFLSFELFVGVQKTLASQCLGQLGLALDVIGNAKLQGVVLDDALGKRKIRGGI